MWFETQLANETKHCKSIFLFLDEIEIEKKKMFEHFFWGGGQNF